MGRTLTAFALALISMTAAQADEVEKPLIALADRLAQSPTKGMVSLVDLAAARAEFAALPAQKGSGRFPVYLSAITMPAALNGHSLVLHLKDMETKVGFSFESIDAVGGWDLPPEALLVLQGRGFDETAIGTALTARGYAVREDEDGPIWHRREDFEISSKTARDEPFSQLGQSGRLALRDGDVLYARSWKGIEKQLGKGNRLSDDANITAFLDLAYDEVFPGTPIQIQVMAGDEISAPGFPPARQLAMIQWQDGATVSGAMALSFAITANAKTAVDTMKLSLKKPLPGTDRSFAEVAGGMPTILTKTYQGRDLAVIGFTQTFDVSQGVSMKTLHSNPHTRLTNMIYRRALETVFAVK